MSWVLVILGLILFVGLVVIHEFGHYLAARRNGVEVEEFGIGFPPKAWGKKLGNGVLFTINWLPIGGFVKLKGEHDADTAKGSYGAASLMAKTKIMTAGVGMNLLTAYVLFTILALVGMPTLIDNQFTVASDTKIIQQVENTDVVLVDSVVEGSPAEEIGIQEDDEIVSVGGSTVDDPKELSSITGNFAGQTVQVEFVNQEDQLQEATTTLNEQGPYLGVAPYSGQTGVEVRRSTWSAPIVAAGVTRDFTVLTLKGLGTAVKGLGSIVAGFFTGNDDARRGGQAAASETVGGPLAVFVILQEGSKIGVIFVLTIIAIISLTLAIMNVLPIPALDGGRLFVTYFYRGLGKKLTPKAEELINGTGFVALMLLIVLITVVDVRRFF